MSQDHQCTKSGKYGILKRENTYIVVEVLKRDANGDIIRMRRNTLASGSIEHCQGIIDKFERKADLELIDSFESWQKG